MALSQSRCTIEFNGRDDRARAQAFCAYSHIVGWSWATRPQVIRYSTKRCRSTVRFARSASCRSIVIDRSTIARYSRMLRASWDRTEFRFRPTLLSCIRADIKRTLTALRANIPLIIVGSVRVGSEARKNRAKDYIARPNRVTEKNRILKCDSLKWDCVKIFTKVVMLSLTIHVINNTTSHIKRDVYIFLILKTSFFIL